MILRLFAALTLGLAASPAAAGTLLWGKVEADMPFAQAKELYPEAHVYSGKGLTSPQLFISKHKIDDCDASVDINMDRKVAEPGAKVKDVRLYGQGCDTKMLTGLVAKYGPPTAMTDNDGKESKTARWVLDGRTIVYKSKGGKGFYSDHWEITYAPIKDLGL